MNENCDPVRSLAAAEMGGRATTRKAPQPARAGALRSQFNPLRVNGPRDEGKL